MLDKGFKPSSSKRKERFMHIRRGELHCCLPIVDAAEVGRLTSLNEMTYVHPLLLGCMILHAQPKPVLNLAVALGVQDPDTAPSFFLATRTTPQICLGVDEIVGMIEQEVLESNSALSIEDDSQAKLRTSLIANHLILSTKTIPVIDVRSLVLQLSGIEGIEEILETESV